MHEFKEQDLSFLIGARLQQLALGLYEFQLKFDSEISILIQQGVLVGKSGEHPTQINADNPTQTKELSFLLGKVIESAQFSEKKDLTLIFDDKSKIILAPSDASPESYVVWHKGDFFAV